MRERFRLPMIVVAAALLGLIALLATLQYRWLGQISDAERDRMRATLEARATEFGRDFDRELTRAYLLFQVEPSMPDQNGAEALSLRHDRWLATARFPRLLKGVYVASRDAGAVRLQRLNVADRTLEPADWPASMADWREHLGDAPETSGAAGSMTIRRLAPPVWESAPALVVPKPLVWIDDRNGRTDMRFTSDMSYVVLEIDRPYVTGELLPALARQHLQNSGEGMDYQVAVISPGSGGALVYGSTPAFSPRADAKVDTAVDLFQVRTQEFGAVAAEIRRFSTFTATVPSPGAAESSGRLGVSGPGRLTPPDRIRIEHESSAVMEGRIEMRGSAPVSIVVQQTGPGSGAGAAAALNAATSRFSASAPARWKLMVQHPSGSLEAAVLTVRRRNLIVSTSILAVLGASVGMLVLSTRRAQMLARQQMEFVATVSHELRTPLAVIRSAGENLADGVVDDAQQIRKYGDLVRNEGRRLTEMVEQILEFAGIHSGQRAFALRPIAVRGMLEDVVEASRTLVEPAGITVEYDVPESVPPVLGDEAALRRVFQNLVGNAVKYGGPARWIGLSARIAAGGVHITVADRGMGIPPAEHSRIFEPFYRAPDVVAAQIQGAGLGLSLVQRIVEAHGGRVLLRSSPGAGSEFTVILPMATGVPVSRDVIPPIDAEHNRSRA